MNIATWGKRASGTRPRMSPRAKRDLRNGLLFASPAIVGLLVLVVYPIVAALYFSLTEYSVLEKPVWVGIDNYRELLSDDPLLVISLRNTLWYVLASVPAQMVTAFSLALLLHSKVRGLRIYRTVFFTPSVVPLVATSVLWLWVFNPQYGLLNSALAMLGIRGPGWIFDPKLAMLCLIILTTWTVGGWVVIYLAGLRDVPLDLLEAADLDGATTAAKLGRIVVPFMTPYLLLHAVNGVIDGFQFFTEVFVVTAGGPGTATLVYSMYLYNNAFRYYKMGYASAMAWILFVIVVLTTILVFRSSAKRVYYGGV